MEVSEAEGLALEDLHFGVETFGDGVVSGEAPHAGDFFSPGMKSVAELNESFEAAGTQQGDISEKTSGELAAFFLVVMFFQQQVCEPLFER